jgi:uncharacterized protein (DUF779 family)
MRAGPARRIVATDAALVELRRLQAEHGPLMLFQSGGCCDGSLPLCLPDGELVVGPNDLLLGEIIGCPVYIDAEQDERWNRPELVLDVAEGAPEGFSLGGAAVHFVTRAARPEATAAG